LRQGDSGYLRAGGFRQIKRKPAPPAADVEHGVVGPDTELGSEVPPLRQLRVVERLLGGFEISAAILLVGIEKEPIEAAVEVVVMRHIAPRTRAWIELLQAPHQMAHDPRRPGPAR